MLDLQAFLRDVESRVSTLQKESIKSEIHDVSLAAMEFIDKSAEDLKRWTELLAEEKLTEADYRSLVKGIGGLGEMTALKEAGLGKAKLDALKKGITETIVESALRFVRLS